MAKINDTTTYPNTTPALTDHVPGTDVSNTANNASGETVTFTLDAILELLRAEIASTANGAGASLIGVEDANGYFTAADQEGVNDELYNMYDGVSEWSGLNPSDYVGFTDLPVRWINAGGSSTYARPSGSYVGIWTNHGNVPPTNAATQDIYQLPAGSEKYRAVTANFTLADSDIGTVIRATSGTLTMTIDTQANVAIARGTGYVRSLTIQNMSGNTLTIQGATGVTVDGVSAGSATLATGKTAIIDTTTDDDWVTWGTE